MRWGLFTKRYNGDSPLEPLQTLQVLAIGNSGSSGIQFKMFNVQHVQWRISTANSCNSRSIEVFLSSKKFKMLERELGGDFVSTKWIGSNFLIAFLCRQLI